jgi:hypothetical protein
VSILAFKLGVFSKSISDIGAQILGGEKGVKEGQKVAEKRRKKKG